MAELTADPHRAARLVLALRQQGVMSAPVLKVMEAIDRAGFAPDEAADMAYEDVHIPIACGQTILPPIVLAQLLAAVRFAEAPAGRTLIIGAGSGYSTALCAELSEHVFALERHASLAESAGERLAALGIANVKVEHGDGLAARADGETYDRIICMGAMESVPDTMLAALAPSGWLAAPIVGDSGLRIETHGPDGVQTGPVLERTLAPLRPGVAHLL
ncbi:MAG: methyltransferase domain-containing protein [Hyphomonadaceae bacterium]|nr:methyltransferase domain-containing protein [Hyphomonadaceae bacterium]